MPVKNLVAYANTTLAIIIDNLNKHYDFIKVEIENNEIKLYDTIGEFYFNKEDIFAFFKTAST